MYVSAISRRFSRGRFTPAIRANLSLPLLVPRVRTDDQHAAVPLDHAAAVAHGLDGRTYFHERRAAARRRPAAPRLANGTRTPLASSVTRAPPPARPSGSAGRPRGSRPCA